MFSVGLDEFLFFILYSQDCLTLSYIINIGKEYMCSEPSIVLQTGIINLVSIKSNSKFKEILFGSLLGDGKLEMAPRAING
jgi:hypothetical protein